MEMEGAWWKAHLRLGEAFMRLERYNDAVQVDTIPTRASPPPPISPTPPSNTHKLAFKNAQRQVIEMRRRPDKIMCPPHVPPPGPPTAPNPSDLPRLLS